MTDNVIILTDELRDINASMDNLIEKINDNMTIIKNNIESLETKDIWSGKSFNNYQDKFDSIMENYEELYSELKNSVNYLNNVCQIYDNIGINIDSLITGEN